MNDLPPHPNGLGRRPFKGQRAGGEEGRRGRESKQARERGRRARRKKEEMITRAWVIAVAVAAAAPVVCAAVKVCLLL